MRARDIGLTIGTGIPGSLNAITDVPGVQVGHVTLVAGDGPLVLGKGPIRTGVTVVLPHDGDPWKEGVYAGFHALNGCGEFTGVHWIKESGLLSSPIAITSTHAIGAVHEGLLRWAASTRTRDELGTGFLPVVAETWDGVLNDGYGMHVRPEHAIEAAETASPGPVTEGCVGGGTGMICHGFKGGIGTSSRVVTLTSGEFTVGVLVQANHGTRERLVVSGVPVGERLPEAEIPVPSKPEGLGSIIAIVATDVPLLPHQCDRLAQRVGLGVGRTGGLGENGSGDMFLAFSTAARGISVGYRSADAPVDHSVRTTSNAEIDSLFALVVEATEEAILNALLAANTMVGVDGVTAHALPAERLIEVMAGSR